ncbi:MAG: G5 domain-containing protein, partial [Clostridia bacterium]|nr:G5 domain-containing protein [Clostridia bacterium]
YDSDRVASEQTTLPATTETVRPPETTQTSPVPPETTQTPPAPPETEAAPPEIRTEIDETYEEIPYKTVYERSALYYETDEIVKREGENGRKRIVTTTVYEDGVAVSTSVSETVEREPVTKIVVLGTKDEIVYRNTVEREGVIPFITETVEDPDLYDDERNVIREGVNGYTEVTYRVTYKRGAIIARDPVSYSTVAPINALVLVGTKPAWTEKTVTEREDSVPYGTEYIYDATLAEGTRIVKQAGEDGYTAVEYKLRYYRGELFSKDAVSRKTYAPRAAIVVIGTKKAEERFVRPYLDKGYKITQNYGGSHYAMDIAVWYGDPILAVKSGTVIYAYDEGYFSKNDLNWTYGTFVVIEHEGGVRSVYAHLKSRTVRAGDKVRGGQVIGYSGNTGRVNPAPTASDPLAGTHLHFEIRVKQGNTYVKTDPRKYIDF